MWTPLIEMQAFQLFKLIPCFLALKKIPFLRIHPMFSQRPVLLFYIKYWSNLPIFVRQHRWTTWWHWLWSNFTNVDYLIKRWFDFHRINVRRIFNVISLFSWFLLIAFLYYLVFFFKHPPKVVLYSSLEYFSCFIYTEMYKSSWTHSKSQWKNQVIGVWDRGLAEIDSRDWKFCLGKLKKK